MRRLHWAILGVVVVSTLANAFFTRQAYYSRGWMGRKAWHTHVTLSGVERELGVLTAGAVALLLVRPKPERGAQAQLPLASKKR